MVGYIVCASCICGLHVYGCNLCIILSVSQGLAFILSSVILKNCMIKTFLKTFFFLLVCIKWDGMRTKAIILKSWFPKVLQLSLGVCRCNGVDPFVVKQQHIMI